MDEDLVDEDGFVQEVGQSPSRRPAQLPDVTARSHEALGNPCAGRRHRAGRCLGWHVHIWFNITVPRHLMCIMSLQDEDDSDDESLQQKIAEEYSTFVAEQAERQEQQRGTSRSWSAPPLMSPRPETQRAKKAEAETLAAEAPGTAHAMPMPMHSPCVLQPAI